MGRVRGAYASTTNGVCDGTAHAAQSECAIGLRCDNRAKKRRAISRSLARIGASSAMGNHLAARGCEWREQEKSNDDLPKGDSTWAGPGGCWTVCAFA